MNRYFITGLLFLFTTPLYCMELSYDVTVKTSDNQKYIVPRWQVRESNTLYTAFLEKLTETPDALSVCIAAPTISYDELHLYSSALAQIDFKHFYKKKLTPEQQRMLTIVAGQHARDEKDELIPKLWDTTMSMKILSLMLDKAAGTELILPSLGPINRTTIYCILDYLQRNAIVSNTSQNNYAFTEYSGDVKLHKNFDGTHYHLIPAECTSRGHRGHNGVKSNFNGYSLNIPYAFSDNTRWKINNFFPLFEHDSSYILTPSEQVGTPAVDNRQKLWFCDNSANSLTFLKEVCLTNNIKNTMFSYNGRYLAINSENDNKQAQLCLISLDLEDNKLKDNAEVYLTGHPGFIHTLCFNRQATLLAAGINKKILFWDTQTHECIFSFNIPNKDEKFKGTIIDFCFNYEDSRLAIITEDHNDGGENYCFTFILYDTSDIKNMTEINRIDLEDSSPQIMYFGPNGDQVVISTHNRAFVIDGWTGEKIMATEKIPYEYQQAEIYAVTPSLLWPLNILATCTSSTQSGFCKKVQLWDITSGHLLTTLIENTITGATQHLCGIGSSYNNHRLFTKSLDGSIMQTDLYDKSIQEGLFKQLVDMLKNLDIFQLYCLYRIDQESIKAKPHVNLHRQSLLYKGIKSLPQSIKDTMYNIFRILHAYGQATQ